MSKQPNVALIIAICLGLILISVYVLNPSGTSSMDARGRVFGYIPYRIPSASNEPTFRKGDYVFASTLAYFRSQPEIGDMIVFHPPHDPSSPFIKRVIAVSGNRVSIHDGMIFVDDVPLNEPYVSDENNVREFSQNIGEVLVPDEHLFVLGDNRDNSLDSRHFGFLPTENVIGKIVTNFDDR